MDRLTVPHPATAPIIIATASAEVAPGAEWIKLMPCGIIRGRDGRGPYVLKDQSHAQQVVVATQAYQAGADLPIDYDHQTQRAPVNGQPVLASGWIKTLEARSDGIYGQVEWTETAAARLAAREYRYFSPAWIGAGPDSTGPVVRLVGGGLTNLPNFPLPAIASQTPGDSMDPDLIKALGLSADVTPATAAAHAQALTDGAKAIATLVGVSADATPTQIATAAQAAVTAVAAALKLSGPATLPQIATAAQQLATPLLGISPAQPDLTKYVPMDVHVAVASQLATLQGEVGTSEVTRVVDDAIQAGKVTPATKDWAVAYASQDLPGFKSYVEKAPVLVAAASQQSGIATPPAATAAQRLSAEEVAVAHQLGLTEDQYLKTKGGK